MADDTYLTFPGRELPKVWRDLAVQLVQHQGWTYRYKRKGGSHPRVIPPEGGLGVALPTTVTDGDAGHRAAYLTNLKRHGAVLDSDGRVVVPARSVSAPVFSAAMTTGVQDIDKPFTDAEWRERQRSSDVWWRQQFAGPTPEPEPAPEPAPAPRAHSAYTQGFLERARAADARRVRDDATGNGRFTLAQARQQLKDGYSMDAVIDRTGWGRLWLQDLADRLGA